MELSAYLLYNKITQITPRIHSGLNRRLTMISSNNLTEFGAELRKIRVNCRFTQEKIYELVGINPDTLRRIENGTVLPKYDTLEILSKIYKCDLFVILKNYRNNSDFDTFYKKIDLIIINNDIKSINSLIEEYYNTVYNKNSVINLMTKEELEQFSIFLYSTKQYFENIGNVDENINILTNSLKLTINSFQLDYFQEFEYNLFEIRILVLISLFFEKAGNYEFSNELLIFSLNYLLANKELNDAHQNLILKIYSNISYNNHKLENHDTVLKYANEGINYAITNHNMYILYLLYARKGIAEFMLGNISYQDSLIKCIHLLEINQQFDLSETYKRIAYEKYSITL